MPVTNGYSRRRPIRLILAFTDSFLILVGVLIGEVLRSGEVGHYFFINEYSVWKIVVFVLVIQIAFYYFDLYVLVYLREKKKIAILLFESLAISFFLLAIFSYSIPSLAIGRGILGLSLMVIFALAFLCRLIFALIYSIKERILIVGAGDLSQEIVRDIYENGRDGIEIIGFVEE